MKKDIPLNILDVMIPMIKENAPLIKVFNDDNAYIHIKDRDTSSGFFFKINGISLKERTKYDVEFKPASVSRIYARKTESTFDGLKGLFQNWLSVLQQYEKIDFDFDDPIVKKNQETFEKEFEILEDDADIVGFNLNQQLLLDEYLSKTIDKIKLYAEDKSEEEKTELAGLIDEATALQNTMTKETKRSVVKRLSHFWARAQKISLGLIKDIFVKVSSEVITKLITGG